MLHDCSMPCMYTQPAGGGGGGGVAYIHFDTSRDDGSLLGRAWSVLTSPSLGSNNWPAPFVSWFFSIDISSSSDFGRSLVDHSNFLCPSQLCRMYNEGDIHTQWNKHKSDVDTWQVLYLIPSISRTLNTKIDRNPSSQRSGFIDGKIIIMCTARRRRKCCYQRLINMTANRQNSKSEGSIAQLRGYCM